jgi:hypothetical protein
MNERMEGAKRKTIFPSDGKMFPNLFFFQNAPVAVRASKVVAKNFCGEIFMFLLG